MFYLLDSSPHDRALNQITLDPATGVVKRVDRYADKSFKAQLLTSIYALHVGSYFGLAGRIIVTLAAVCMPLFFITGWLLYLDRRRKKNRFRTHAKVFRLRPAMHRHGWWVLPLRVVLPNNWPGRPPGNYRPPGCR
ncbi:PepSY-associated TM helix domain-containing protein [Pseudomonas parakoreensis]